VFHTVHFSDGASLFTKKCTTGIKTVMRVPPLRVSALLCHLQGLDWAMSTLKPTAVNGLSLQLSCGYKIKIFLQKI
jgi:hypothetical protein